MPSSIQPNRSQPNRTQTKTPAWKSDSIRQQKNLYLSATERASIQQKLPPAEDGRFYADAVFEGGGVRGAAFLGALRCFDDAGIQLRKVAGTSAGAITAALVAAQFSIEQLEQVIGELDFEQEFLSQKSSPFIFNGSPEDDLQSPVSMLINLFLVGKKGQYSSEPFYQWLSGILADRLETFAPVLGHRRRSDGSEIPWYQQRQLKIIISNISSGEMQILPEDLPKYKTKPADFSVAEAVRLSMSIPLFFEPGRLGQSTIIDGGILSNFPLWLYDVPNDQTPLCPTFGLRLTTDSAAIAKPVDSVVGVIKQGFKTIIVAHDRHYSRTNDLRRIVNIDTSEVTTTQFNMGNPEKDYLYAQGYAMTKQFLLQRWDWQQHLQERGHRASVPEMVAPM